MVIQKIHKTDTEHAGIREERTEEIVYIRLLYYKKEKSRMKKVTRMKLFSSHVDIMCPT